MRPFLQGFLLGMNFSTRGLMRYDTHVVAGRGSIHKADFIAMNHKIFTV